MFHNFSARAFHMIRQCGPSGEQVDSAFFVGLAGAQGHVSHLEFGSTELTSAAVMDDSTQPVAEPRELDEVRLARATCSTTSRRQKRKQ